MSNLSLDLALRYLLWQIMTLAAPTAVLVMEQRHTNGSQMTEDCWTFEVYKFDVRVA